MLPLNLILTLLVALPPTLAALSAPGHRPAPGAHNLFASNQQSSSLLERAASVGDQSLLDDELCTDGPTAGELDLEELILAKVNMTVSDDDWEDGEERAAMRLGKRAVKNPKYWVDNPKFSPRPAATSKTTTAKSTTKATTTSSTSTRASTTSTRASTTTTSAAQSATAVACAITADCAGRIIPASSHQYCANKICSFRCNSGYTLYAGACVKNVGTGTASATKATSTSKTTTSQKPASTTALVLPKPPSTTCATQYTNTAAGAVYGPGLGSFPMLPRPSTFVVRSKSALYLDGEIYRIVGPNIYWLGLEENVIPSPSYPDKGRVREAMAQSVAMGANTIRAHTLGISTGNSLSVWPSAYATNDKAFDSIDYAIWAARNYGLRLIIPLTDEHAYYHGGKYDFIRWAGANTNDGSQFYTSAATITIFKAYIKVLLNHVNAYTGVALKDDPTIMAWETGNELGAYMLSAGAPPASWTDDIGNYIKSIAPNQLVADGTDGLVNYSGGLANTGVAVAPVDLVTDHFYPATNWLLQKDKGWMQYYTKNFYVGELDWTYAKGGDSPTSFYAIVESMPYSGSMIWSVFGHDAQCCNWVEHNDGYTLSYPNGNSADLQKQILILVQHWYRMRGLTPPTALPAVACPQPELLP